jgi:cell division septum initiation protein DivIVA
MAEDVRTEERIVRDDFRRVRRGWDPDEVRAHLEAVAERFEQADDEEPSQLASSATERVGAIVAAAEKAAAELERDARGRAKEIDQKARAEAKELLTTARAKTRKAVEEARAEATRLVEAGRAEAEARVVATQDALTALLEGADRLHLEAQAEAPSTAPAEEPDEDLADAEDGGSRRPDGPLRGSVVVAGRRMPVEEEHPEHQGA